MMKSMLMGASVFFLGANANAWVDGTYTCRVGEVTISTATITGSQTTPFLMAKNNGKVSFQGFPTYTEQADGKELLSMPNGNPPRDFYFKDGNLFFAGVPCPPK